MKTPPPTNPAAPAGGFAPLSCRRYLFDRYWEAPRPPAAGEAPPADRSAAEGPGPAGPGPERH